MNLNKYDAVLYVKIKCKPWTATPSNSFLGNVYSLSCQKLDQKINTTDLSVP